MEKEYDSPKKMVKYLKISVVLGIILAFVEWYIDFSKPVLAGMSLSKSDWLAWLVVLSIIYPLVSFFVLAPTLTLIKGFFRNKILEALIFFIIGGLIIFIMMNFEVPFYFTPISFLIVPLFYLLHLIPQRKISES